MMEACVNIVMRERGQYQYSPAPLELPLYLVFQYANTCTDITEKDSHKTEEQENRARGQGTQSKLFVGWSSKPERDT